MINSIPVLCMQPGDSLRFFFICVFAYVHTIMYTMNSVYTCIWYISEDIDAYTSNLGRRKALAWLVHTENINVVIL